MSGVHGNRPKIVAGQTKAAEEMIRSKETCRCSTLHERNRKVAADAVSSQHDSWVLRINSQPLLPGTGIQAAGSRR